MLLQYHTVLWLKRTLLAISLTILPGMHCLHGQLQSLPLLGAGEPLLVHHKDACMSAAAKALLLQLLLFTAAAEQHMCHCKALLMVVAG